jgi:hypothetical protein
VIVLAVIALLVAGYTGAYIANLEPDLYYRFDSVSGWEYPYPGYRFGGGEDKCGGIAAIVFYPASLLDRTIRPAYWKPHYVGPPLPPAPLVEPPPSLKVD